jgi:murein L,D-transpeptidase YafK
MFIKPWLARALFKKNRMLKGRSLNFKIIVLISIPIITVGLLFGTIRLLKHNPPVAKIEEGRKIIAKAIEAEADVYSPKELKLAEKYWKQAMDEWKLNNSKTAVFRKFKKTTALADLAIENAKIAKIKAQQTKSKLRIEVEKRIKELKETLKYIEFATSKLPLNHSIRKKLTPISIILHEAEMAYTRKNLITAMEKVESISKKVVDLNQITTEVLHDYFKDFNQWVNLNEEMKNWSKTNNSVSLVVDKFSRKCIVYKAGRKHKEFDVELSVNWLGDKVQSGDRATPEGKYRVTKKKSGGKTTYHKSLEIDFPNAEDKLRFEQEKIKGIIPRNSRIGGSIAIHGGGGRGIDWTEGCVALENNDMDKLFSLCSVGSPVAIVGSLVSLDKIFEEFKKE